MNASSEQIGTSAPPRAPPTRENSDGTGPTAAFFGRWTGLRARLMLFVTLVLLGPFGFVVYLVYNHYEHTRINILKDLSRFAGDMTNRDFGIGVPIRQLLAALAYNENIVEHRGERCSQDVRALLAAEARYASIGAATPDGTIFCNTAEMPSQKPNVSDREWFQETIAKRDFNRGQYVVSRISGERVLVFAYPAMEKGGIKAIVFAALDLDWMSRAIKPPLSREYATAYFLHQDGTVLARSHNWGAAIGRRIEDKRLLDALGAGKEGPVLAKGLTGIEKLYILNRSKAIGADSLYFAVGVDTNTLMLDAFSELKTVLVFFVLIAALTYLAAWQGSAVAILRPIRRLQGTIARFSNGDSSARIGGGYARNEIGVLGRAFDDMADAIGRHKAESETAAVKLRGVIDNIEEGIVTADERGTILTFNPAAERITGYAAKEAIGRNVAMLAAEPHRSRHPEYIAAYLATGKGKAIGESVRYRPLEAQHKDGTTVPILLGLAESWVEGSRVFIGVLHDISAQVKAEASAKRRARDMELLLQTSPAAIVALDRDSKVIWWNAAAERIFGYTAAEAMGRPHPVVPESETEHFQDHFQRTFGGESLLNIRGTRQAKNGKKVEVEFSSSPLRNSENNVVGVLYVVNDVTERVQLEGQLSQAQKMEAVGQLTGGIAHDFNNLLGILIGNLDLIRERVTNDRETLELTDAALDAGLRGAELNKRLLAFSRRQTLAPETVDVNAALTDMARMLRRSLGERMEIELHCADGVWPVRVDPVQLETAIVNLGVNARDAMPNGGILTFETRNAPLDADYAARHENLNPGDYVMVAVSDNGVGMTPEVLARVFDPFFTTKPVGKGTGLGLSMVYGFLKQSGGHVNVYSEPGKGTTIRLYLPRDMAEAEAPKTAEAVANHSPTQGELVLVVEDNIDMRRVAIRQLEELGYRVVEAENADKALALLDEGLKPGLAFLDVIMPGSMDGIELAHHIEKRLPGVGILLTSGFTERATGEARKNGDKTIPFPLLGKPYRKDDLARAVRAALDNRKNGISP